MTNNLKIFATDMDGTFLHADRSYDLPRLERLLPKLEQQKALFCAASGRQLLALHELFAPIKDRIAYVAENGGVVALGEELIFVKKFTQAQITELIKILRQLPGGTDDLLISGLKGAYLLDTASEAYYQKTLLYYANVQRIHKVADIKDDDLLKITTNFPETEVQLREQELNAQAPYVRATTTGFTSIDIIPAGISKATGLEALAQRFGLNATNVVAFGDQMNDLEMLKYAGTAVAVANAVPRLKAVASYSIGSNETDSVLTEMEHLIQQYYD